MCPASPHFQALCSLYRTSKIMRMKTYRYRTVSCTLTAFLTLCSAATTLAAPREGRERLYAVKKLKPSSTTRCVERFGEAIVLVKSPVGSGSGFLINNDGYIVTNFHVIEGEQNISVTVFRQERKEFRKIKYVDVRIVALDHFFDLALLKLERPDGKKSLSSVTLAKTDDLRVGDEVFAIGNPLGLTRSVSKGVVSSLNRYLEGRLFIETDTAINPGNSGGALFNSRCEVVGVTNMGVAWLQGLNFAIPIHSVKYFLDHREAYAFDKDNPNTGFRYLDPPRKAGTMEHK